MENNVKLCLFPNGAKKAIVLSYDDGRIQDERLVGIFNKYNLKGTFHLNSSTIGKEGYIAKEQARALYRGHEISLHGLTHPFLTDIPRERAVYEIMKDKEELEKISNYPVRGMSYPYGAYSASVLEILRACGMEYSRTTIPAKTFIPPSDFLAWHPNCHHNDNLLENFDRFANNNRHDAQRLTFFYAWGHSYEFDNDDNWELIENFCKKVHETDGLWSATNIELVDYLNAVRNLKFTADLSIVQNPSAAEVWFTYNDVPASVKGGETKKLQ